MLVSNGGNATIKGKLEGSVLLHTCPTLNGRGELWQHTYTSEGMRWEEWEFVAPYCKRHVFNSRNRAECYFWEFAITALYALENAN